WVPARYYKVQSKAFNGGTPETQFTGPETKQFYIDNSAPTVTILMPDVSYKNNMPTISGTVTDDLDGQTNASKTVYFRLKRTNPSAQYFVAVSSAWVADP